MITLLLISFLVYRLKKKKKQATVSVPLFETLKQAA